MAPAPNSTSRFGNRVEDYVKYRPDYPAAVMPHLRATAGLRPDSVVADIGSGTGISTRMFLEHGNVVYAVEPNAAMRQAAEDALTSFPHFVSVAGTAEHTTLSAASIDLIVAGQAFHWFDVERTRTEWARILRPDGRVVLMWNDRDTRSTPFLADYEALLRRHGTDYASVAHSAVEATDVPRFFGARGYSLTKFPHAQICDFDGLRGRLMSSSYVPAADDPRAIPMLNDLRALFDREQRGGRVELIYHTNVYVGSLS